MGKALLTSSLFLAASLTLPPNPSVLGERTLKDQKPIARDFFTFSSPQTAPSSFQTRTAVTKRTLPFATRYENDPELEIDTEKVKQAGRVGERVETYEILLWRGKEVERRRIALEIAPALSKIVRRGTKMVVRELETPQGVLKYTRKLKMWATSYDPFCKGCNAITAIGLRAGFGVVAVDPKVIPLRSRLYIPGYGLAVAGDTGGKIKGKRIDLGFDDVKKGWWSARYTDVYVLY